MVWLNRKNSRNRYKSLRVNGLFGGGKKDNKEDGQSKVRVFKQNYSIDFGRQHKFNYETDVFLIAFFYFVLGRNSW